MDDACALRITLLSRPALLSCVRRTVEAWCSLTGCAEAELAAVGLAMDEAITNIIRHGYDNNPDGSIEIEFHRDGPTVQFTLTDNARQVPLESICSRPLDEVRPGGLGVYLMKETMDEAVWSHRPEGGMQLILRKTMATSPEVTMREHDVR